MNFTYFLINSLSKLIFTLSTLVFNCSKVVAPIITELTNGYEFKLKEPVAAKSGKRSYDLFSKGRFAWVVDFEDEEKLIVTMKKSFKTYDCWSL